MVRVHAIRMELFSIFPHPFVGVVPARLRFSETHPRKPFAQFLFPVLFLILLASLHRCHVVVVVDDRHDVSVNVVFLAQKSIFD